MYNYPGNNRKPRETNNWKIDKVRQNKYSLSPDEKSEQVINDFKLKQAGFRSHTETVPVMHKLSVLK